MMENAEVSDQHCFFFNQYFMIFFYLFYFSQSLQASRCVSKLQKYENLVWLPPSGGEREVCCYL